MKEKNHLRVLVSGTVVSYMLMNVKLWISMKELQAFTRALNCCLETESAIPWCYCMDDLCHAHCLYWLYGRLSHGDDSALCRVCVCGCLLHTPSFCLLFISPWGALLAAQAAEAGLAEAVTLRLDSQFTYSPSPRLCEAEHTSEVRNMVWGLPHTKPLLTNPLIAMTCVWNWFNGLKSAVRK